MKVLIFGCGPAGMFAAHAAVSLGHSVIIVSKRRRSEMFGAQYLHQPIPGLSEGEGDRVQYVLQGTADQYRRKVYGEKRVEVSPESLESDHLAWDIREAYYRAFAMYHPLIVDAEVAGGIDAGEAVRFYGVDKVFNTMPAPVLCLNEDHVFKTEEVWSVGDAPERGMFCPVSAPGFSVVCNGEDAPRWYRASNVFGYQTAEWPDGPKPPLEGVARVTKPLSTNCDCWPSVVRLGRYGRWTKGVLSHEAYVDTMKELP